MEGYRDEEYKEPQMFLGGLTPQELQRILKTRSNVMEMVQDEVAILEQGAQSRGSGPHFISSPASPPTTVPTIPNRRKRAASDRVLPSRRHSEASTSTSPQPAPASDSASYVPTIYSKDIPPHRTSPKSPQPSPLRPHAGAARADRRRPNRRSEAVDTEGSSHTGYAAAKPIPSTRARHLPGHGFSMGELKKRISHRNDDEKESHDTEEVKQCNVCLLPLTTQSTRAADCGHVFHANCLMESLKHVRACPECRHPIE